MLSNPIKKENLSKFWRTWLLSITACILISVIIYQNIKIKNAQDNLMDSSTVAEADTGRWEPLTDNLKTNYEKTIKQLQTQLKNLQATVTDDLDPETERAGAMPPPDGYEGGPNGDRSIIDRVYTPLIERLELSSEESKNFQDFLTERRQAWIEIEDEIYLSQPENEKEALKKELEDLAWEYDEQALEILGYKNYQKYNEYNSCLGVFITDPIDEFEKKLGQTESINKFQEEQLVSAMAEEFEDFMALTVPEANGLPGFRVGMRDEQITSKIAAGLDNLQERYLDRARAILSVSQMKIFEEFIKTKIALRKAFYE